MGVPGFFRWIIKNCKNNEILIPTPKHPINNLFIDANSLIHNASNYILNSHQYHISYDIIEKEIIIQCINEFEKLINFTNPKNLIYIAIDGVAPCSKITQQRYRRYGSVYENILKTPIRNKYNKYQHTWLNLHITPGTKFMEILHKEIEKYCVKYNETHKQKIVYSSCYECGEGEHKIMNYIKQNKLDNVLIYGLDADLLFLSMILECQQLYLIRENINIYDENDNTYKYVNMFQLKKNIFNLFMNKLNKTDICLKNMDMIDDKNIIYDFIVICYFFGNDFLPCNPILDIKYDINAVISIYMDVKTTTLGYLLDIQHKTINIHFFSEFLNKLAKEELNIFKNEFEKRWYSNKQHSKIICEKLNGFEKENYEIDFMVNTLNHYEKLDYKDFKFNCYEYYFSQIEKQQEIIDNCCKDYLDGLMWTYNYYFSSSNFKENDYQISWVWNYQYPIAPFISDLYDYVRKNNYDVNNFYNNIKKYHEYLNNVPLTQTQQLLSVIPKSQMKCISDNLYKISENLTISYMFPLNYNLYTLHKFVLYKCIPRIPFIDFYKIKCVCD